jgi:chorismate mutase
MYCRGIRGATTVDYNDRKEILEATAELLRLMVHENNVHIEEIASASFTLTDDLDAVFPAQAARQIGWNEVPLICMREIPVPNSLSKCIRVLLLVNTTRCASEIQHIYIRKAVSLRPEYEPETR